MVYALHVDRIDWKETQTRSSITKFLIGKTDYYSLNPGVAKVEQELKILRDATFYNWGGSSIYGKPYYQHFLTLMRLLMPAMDEYPAVDITPSLADTCYWLCRQIGAGGKVLNLIGSQSSGKSSATARIIATFMAIYPETAAGYVANPLKTAADSTIWGDIETMFNHVQSAWPHLFENYKVFSDSRIQVSTKTPKGGFVELRSVAESGAFKGIKTVKDNDGRTVGPIIIVIDEVNEVKSQSFIDQLANVCSQVGLLVITSQNFKGGDNMGVILCNPVEDGDRQAGYEHLSEPTDHIWKSFLNGITLRFSGLKSPNILAGYTIYPYLFDQANLELQINSYGPNSPEYYSQVLSFPLASNSESTVLPESAVRSSLGRDTMYAIDAVLFKVAFCDPAFGGGDRCLYRSGTVANCRVRTGEHEEKKALLILDGPERQIFVDLKATVTNGWIERARALDVTLDTPVGEKLPPEEQVAISCAEFLKKDGIPAKNFGYDFSMRAGIVTSMAKYLSGSEAVGSLGPSTDLHLHFIGKPAKEICVNLIDEMIFAAVNLVYSKVLRGLGNAETAILELQRTTFTLQKQKRRVQRKLDYKALYGKSPDSRDTLVGLCLMALTRGLTIPLHNRSRQAAGHSLALRNKFKLGHILRTL